MVVTRSTASPRANFRSSGSFSSLSPVVDASPIGRSVSPHRHDPLGDHAGDLRVAIEAKEEPARRQPSSTRARGNTARRIRVRRRRRGSPRCRSRECRRRRRESARAGRPRERGSEDAVDAQVSVRRLPARGRSAPRDARRERVHEPLFASVGVRDDARDREESILRRETVVSCGAFTAGAETSASPRSAACDDARSPRRHGRKGRSCLRNRTSTPAPRRRS
jgi:hypothetical protein